MVKLGTTNFRMNFIFVMVDKNLSEFCFEAPFFPFLPIYTSVCISGQDNLVHASISNKQCLFTNTITTLG